MASPELIAHWPLNGTPRDAQGQHHGQALNVAFGPGPDGSHPAAAQFNGRDSVIEVPDAEPLRLGNRDFTASVWVRCPAPISGVFGDVLSKFDPAGRCGLNLQIAGSSPAYNAMSDTRHVHFGIDDGYVGPWQNLGKPWPSNALVTCLIVMEGELYAGIADAADPMDAAHVFRWEGGNQWVDCGRLGSDPSILSVQAMVVHKGSLYAGTGVWDWYKARGHVEGFTPSPTRVFRYEGGTDWRDLGQVGEGTRVLCMASFDGDVYAGLDAHGRGACFRYDGSTWVDCGAPDGRNFESLMPLAGTLYGATHGSIFRYEGGQQWTCIGDHPHDITQIHSLQVAQGKLHAGTWPQGYVIRHEGGQDWTVTGRLGIPEGLRECNEINDLTVHNGKLYAGVIPKAQVYRYESDGVWTLMGSLASRADWAPASAPSWCRVTSLTSFQGRLFACTGSCIGRSEDVDPDGALGCVYALQVGQVVSHENDIGDDWTHVAAVRRGRKLRLYVNGVLSAVSQAPAGHLLDLTNTRPLCIGFGPQTHFTGAVADLRLYAAALTARQVRAIHAVRGG